eukprot:6214577-Pleurochrysis_carterae.AAC.2
MAVVTGEGKEAVEYELQSWLVVEGRAEQLERERKCLPVEEKEAGEGECGRQCSPVPQQRLLKSASSRPEAVVGAEAKVAVAGMAVAA